MVDIQDGNRGYIIAGALVIIANFLVLITLLSSTKLIAKHQLLIALAFADIIGGCGTFSAGYGRFLIYSQTPVPNDTTVADCLRAPWVPLLTIGGEWPAIIVLAIGGERCLAVFKPMFYRSVYNNKHRVLIIVASAAFQIGALLWAYGNTLIYGNLKEIVSPSCFNVTAFGPFFSDFFRGLVIFGNFGGFCLSFVAFLSARQRSKAAGADGAQMRQEAKRINLHLAVSGFSVLLATLPQLVSAAAGRGWLSISSSASYLNYIVYYISSLINFFLYLIKNEYRARFVWLITGGRVHSGAQTAPMAPTTGNIPIRHR